MRIAVIDDGIDRLELRKRKLLYDLTVAPDNAVRERNQNDPFLTAHGTMCARIIEKYAEDAEFISICVFRSAELKTECGKLAAALLWCLEHRIPLVHMSVGSRLYNDWSLIRPIIARMIKQRQIIVAAGCNQGGYAIPASLGGVFGVVSDPQLLGAAYRPNSRANGILLSASSRHRLLKGSRYPNASEEWRETEVTNSYAAPAVTAAVSHILEKHKPYSLSVPEVYRELTGGKEAFQPIKPDFIEEAQVFNISGKPLSSKNFFFTCVGEFTALSEFIHGYKKGCCLVFLPSESKQKNREAVSFINERRSEFTGILYAGEQPEDFLYGEKNILMWNENFRGISKWNPAVLDEREIGCPVIFICGGAGRGLDLSFRLQTMFREEGYQCVCASNQEYAYLYGFDYFKGEETGKAAQYAYAVYEPDLIIGCVGEQGINRSVFEEADHYFITFQEKTDAKAEEKNQGILSVCYNDMDVKRLYDQIVSYFQ